MNLAELTTELLIIAAAAPMTTHRALEHACKVIEDEAKSELGTYQPGWAMLAQSTLADKARKGFDVPSPLERTFAMGRSIDHFVEGKSGYVGSESMIALYQELGTSRIPPRPFLSTAAKRKGREISELIGRDVYHRLIS